MTLQSLGVEQAVAYDEQKDARPAPSRLSAFVELTKPRVMSLAIFTAISGFVLAPAHGPWIGSAISLLAVAAGAGGAGALNMWWEGDVDALMSRTARRPIPSGRVTRLEALTLGSVLSAAGVAILLAQGFIAAALLLAGTIAFYVGVYTMCLRRMTPANIVIGGAAGATPPLIGWLVSGSGPGLLPFVLFLMIFLWIPPHFWSLSLLRTNEYARARIPMTPVVAGARATTLRILIYTIGLVAVSVLPGVLWLAGPVYDAVAAGAGAVMVWLAADLHRAAPQFRAQFAHRLFSYSILYLFVVFAGLLADKGLTELADPAPNEAVLIVDPSPVRHRQGHSDNAGAGHLPPQVGWSNGAKRAGQSWS